MEATRASHSDSGIIATFSTRVAIKRFGNFTRSRSKHSALNMGSSSRGGVRSHGFLSFSANSCKVSLTFGVPRSE